jgi:hypothetical protein
LTKARLVASPPPAIVIASAGVFTGCGVDSAVTAARGGARRRTGPSPLVRRYGGGNLAVGVLSLGQTSLPPPPGRSRRLAPALDVRTPTAQIGHFLPPFLV